LPFVQGTNQTAFFPDMEYLSPSEKSFYPCLLLKSNWRNRNRWCDHLKEIRRA